MNAVGDDAARDLVQRAYAGDPELGDFDVEEGLQEVLDRVRRVDVRATSAAHRRANVASAAGGGRAITLVPARVYVAEGQASGPAEKNTILVMGSRGGIRVSPRANLRILFGRQEADVHVAFGLGDPHVSRQQGELEYRLDRWWLRNTGRLPIRLPSMELLLSQQVEPLPRGYTPVFVVTPRGTHLLELHVGGYDARVSEDLEGGYPRDWALSREERLALVVLSRRYLLHEPHPLPLTARQAAAELAELEPNVGWTASRVAHLVAMVRERLSAGGVTGLTQAELGEPSGSFLTHNLIMELLRSGTLVPQDLHLLDKDH